jgi:hypothetical protein
MNLTYKQILYIYILTITILLCFISVYVGYSINRISKFSVIDIYLSLDTNSNTIHLIDDDGREVGSVTFDRQITLRLIKVGTK